MKDRPAAASRAASARQVTPAARGPGRPAAGNQSLLSREVIVGRALRMTREMPLQDLSIVRLAQELDVAPALIHYYLGGRDALTSAVMNAFYRELFEGWPPTHGQWRRDLTAACKHNYNAYVLYGGIAAYSVTHNKYRLVQAVEPGETDYGLLQFERFIACVREAGFDAKRTGMYAHLLKEFLIGYAQATGAHRWPGEHAGFLNAKLAALDKRQFPAAHFISKTFTELDAGLAFDMGLELFLNALELERRRFRAAQAARKAAKP